MRNIRRSDGELTHWMGACALAEHLAFDSDAAEHMLDGAAAFARREQLEGRRAAVALARAMDRVVRAAGGPRCGAEQVAHELPTEAATRGRGSVRAAAIVAMEVARRASLEAHLVLTHGRLVVIVADDAARWSALWPSFDGIAWVPTPASIIDKASARVIDAQDATRALVAAVARTLPSASLHQAMCVLDELEAA